MFCALRQITSSKTRVFCRLSVINIHEIFQHLYCKRIPITSVLVSFTLYALSENTKMKSEDKRFSYIASDPKFRHIPKATRKVKVDNRFQSMFKDKEFNVKYTVDKRGRPINHTTKEDLKRYYKLSSEESDLEEEAIDVGRYVKAPKSDEKSELVLKGNSDKETEHIEDLKTAKIEGKSDLNLKDKSDKQVAESIKNKLRNLNIDYARGESALFSESSSDDEESEEEEVSDDEIIDHNWGELDAEASTTDKATYRLAACNMDWDRIRAIDLMLLFNSFVPSDGLIKSVTIYPSEFGKQRMKEEEVAGPAELVEENMDDDNTENEEGSKYHMEKLRKYQLNRLKYYYAVVVFDSANTANKVYTECDGMEYESSATRLDLRFIPDDMIFDDEPKEFCDELPDSSNYQPRFFTTTALQQAKVNLTWDETNPDRIEFTQKLNSGQLDNITDADLQAYIATSSDEEYEEEPEDEKKDDNEDKPTGFVSKYRALLSDLQEKEKNKEERDIQMEVVWDVNVKEKCENLVSKKIEEKQEKTPFEQYLEKRKAKLKAKRDRKKQSENTDSDSDIPDDMNDPFFAEEVKKAGYQKKSKAKEEDADESEEEQKKGELELLVMNEDDNKKHFSLKKIQEQDMKKKKKKKQKDRDHSKADDFTIDVSDERFSALFTSHHFNIEPTNPHYKKTKNMEALINEKLKRKTNASGNAIEENTDCKRPKIVEKKTSGLSTLIKSVKLKTQAYLQ